MCLSLVDQLNNWTALRLALGHGVEQVYGFRMQTRTRVVAHDGSRASREALTLTCAELLLSADDVSHMLGARGTSEGSNAWPFFGACMRDNSSGFL